MHNVQHLNLRAQSCQRNLIQRLLLGYFLRQSIEGVKSDASDLRIQGCFRPQKSGAVQIPIEASNWCSKTFYETDKKVFSYHNKSLLPWTSTHFRYQYALTSWTQWIRNTVLRYVRERLIMLSTVFFFSIWYILG